MKNCESGADFYRNNPDDVVNHSETPAEDFDYRDGDFVVIEGYKGTDPIVLIPEQINGHPVTVVNANGFNLDSNVI